MDRFDSALARNVLSSLVSLRELLEQDDLGILVSRHQPDVVAHFRDLHRAVSHGCQSASALVGLLSLEEARLSGGESV